MKKCDSLEEVRTEVDKIDDKLVELISQRSHLIRQAAGFKNSVEEVKAVDRIDFILQRVRHKAIELGVSPNMISELFTIMINEMVETEIAELRNKKTF
jgi:isochorismate pyruvate lyase